MLWLDLPAYGNFDLNSFLYKNIKLVISYIINIVHLIVWNY